MNCPTLSNELEHGRSVQTLEGRESPRRGTASVQNVLSGSQAPKVCSETAVNPPPPAHQHACVLSVPARSHLSREQFYLSHLSNLSKAVPSPHSIPGSFIHLILKFRIRFIYNLGFYIIPFLPEPSDLKGIYRSRVF